MDLVFFHKVAKQLDSYQTKDAGIASNAVRCALIEANRTSGSQFGCALENLAKFATALDKDGHRKAADLLDLLLKNAKELWESAHDRDEKYDAKTHNEQSLFQSLQDVPKLDPVEPVLETMKGEATSLLTRYSPDYPGVMLMRVSDGVYQDTMTRKVYDFNKGWVSETGVRYPGGSMANQTPTASHYLGMRQVFESSGHRTRPR